MRIRSTIGLIRNLVELIYLFGNIVKLILDLQIFPFFFCGWDMNTTTWHPYFCTFWRGHKVGAWQQRAHGRDTPNKFHGWWQASPLPKITLPKHDLKFPLVKRFNLLPSVVHLVHLVIEKVRFLLSGKCSNFSCSPIVLNIHWCWCQKGTLMRYSLCGLQWSVHTRPSPMNHNAV